jgi:selenophosphate synthase
MQLLLADAQTSGGLLIAVQPAKLPELLQALAQREVAYQAVVGEILATDTPGEITVV